MCKKIILVSGYKRAGKDHISTLLNQEIPSSVIYSMASPLKDILATTLNMSVASFDTFKNDAEPICFSNGTRFTDFREVIQHFGNEAMKRHFGESVWVNSFLSKHFSEQVIIISDWRFKIEHLKISQEYENIITVRVHDANIQNEDMHASETELDGFEFDYIIDNTAKDDSVIPQIQNLIKRIQDGSKT